MKVIIVSILCFLSSSILAQNYSKIEMTEFYKDLQIWKKQDDKMLLAWWLPSEYWAIAFEGNSSVSKEVKNKIKTAFSNYSVFCMADIKYIDYNTTTHKSYTDLKKTFSVIDSSGKVISAQEENKLPDETLEMGNLLKPFLSNLIGKVGDGISIFYVKNIDANGNKLFNPFTENSFKVTLSGQEFQWQLPLPSLLPKKHCPTDNKEMNGSWNYCPIHGVKL